MPNNIRSLLNLVSLIFRETSSVWIYVVITFVVAASPNREYGESAGFSLLVQTVVRTEKYLKG